MNKILFGLIALVPLIMAGQFLSIESSNPHKDLAHAFVVDRTYEGVERCKTCHRKEEDGAQFVMWEEGPHSKAYESLASDKAKEYAADRGIANPQTASECLECHVTGYDAPPELLGSKYQISDGVGCESCHGPGGDYYKKSTMVAITKGEIEGASVGLIKPDEAVCVTCHNDRSPAFDGFNFEEYREKILHPIPDAKMAEYK